MAAGSKTLLLLAPPPQLLAAIRKNKSVTSLVLITFVVFSLLELALDTILSPSNGSDKLEHHKPLETTTTATIRLVIPRSAEPQLSWPPNVDVDRITRCYYRNNRNRNCRRPKTALSSYHLDHTKDCVQCSISSETIVDFNLQPYYFNDATFTSNFGNHQPVGLGTRELLNNQQPHRDGWLINWLRNNRWRGLFSIVEQVEAIRVLHLDAPRSVAMGQPIRLRCVFELKGDKLQSLSWCRNGHEFYSYWPSDRQKPVKAYNSTGINVDLTRSRNGTVVLTNTTNETSGRYKCEITATNFHIDSMETFVEIISVSSGVNRIIPYLSAILTPILILLFHIERVFFIL